SSSPCAVAERGVGGEVLGCPSDCFRAGTRVKTEKGWRSIETLRAGDFVWTHLGRLRRVVGVQRRPHVGAMLGLQLESSPIVVWSTPAQQFLVAPGPHPPTPFPQAETGGQPQEPGYASPLTPQPPLHK